MSYFVFPGSGLTFVWGVARVSSISESRVGRTDLLALSCLSWPCFLSSGDQESRDVVGGSRT